MTETSKPYAKGLGFRYLLETKYHPGKGVLDDLGRLPQPDMFKMYPGERVALKEPAGERADLWEALRKRRSKRRYDPGPMSFEDLGALSFAVQGVTGQSGPFVLRTAPSAGALYPFETYVFVREAQNVAAGLYHLDVREFSLVKIKDGDLSDAIYRACLNQAMVKRAQVVFIWTHVALRTMAKYRSRGVRYLFMDLGHVCQNLCLAAAALGLGCCPIGAFFDDEMNDILEVDGVDESVVYLATVGLK